MAQRNENFVSLRQVDDGISSTVDPQDIQVTEVSDALNIIFRNGYPESRPGSKIKWSKPDGESNNLLNLFRAKDSKGANLCIAVYAPNFYVHDDTNDQWIKINHTYNPSSTYKSYSYGYINWNAGKSADVLYAGNGQEDCIKWPIVLRHTSVITYSSDTTITVDDGTYFPSSGKIVIKESGGTEIYASYYSVSTNVLNLTAPIGVDVASGAGVTFEISDATTLIKGNIFAKQNGRLFIAGKSKFETVAYYSVINSPEDFTTTGSADSSGNKPITDGNGGITSMVNFGEYILVTKSDSAYKLSFEVDQANNSFLVNTIPVFSDVSLGPVSNSASVKKNDNLLFATLTEGLYSLSPGSTGTITSVEPSLISQDIYRHYHSLNFSNSKAVSWNQFVFWSCASNTVSDTVLVLDLLKSDKKKKFVWSKFDNWGVQDWLVYNDSDGELLYFGNRIDGNIYHAFASDYVDFEQSGSQTPYICSFTTKRMDHGFSPIPLGQNATSRASLVYASHPDKLKRADLLHIQGFITTTGTLYVDIMYDENGRLQTITKSISGNESLIYQPISTPLAMAMLGLPILGGSTIDDLDSVGFINEYLPINIKYGFTNITFKFYTVDPGVHWGITGLAYNGILMDAIPSNLVQEDTSTATISTTSLIPSSISATTILIKSWVFDYTPTGTVDGINTSFTIPAASQVLVFADGSLVKGSGIDYSFSGDTSIVFTSGRQPYSTLSVSYLPL